MREVYITDFGAVESAVNNSREIQSAINECRGGGIVRVPKGTFVSGTLRLYSGVTLYLDKGAVLRGSADYQNYNDRAADDWHTKGWIRLPPAPRWYNAFICAADAENVSIIGDGTLDGADCYDPDGEENFRGPHCILFGSCKNVRVSGIQIINSANYAVFVCSSNNVTVERTTIRGGHDGIHNQRVSNLTITDCDFRTGDDCVAGSDNENFVIRDCKFNTSCNGFRLGCQNLTAERCRFWGPGEYQHLSQKRNNMLNAMIHFAPPNRDTRLPSGNWVVRDCTVDSVKSLYWLKRDEFWQSGQPVTSVIFERVQVDNMEEPVTMFDSVPITRISVYDSYIALKPIVTDKSVINACNFDSIYLRNTTLSGNGDNPAITVCNGNLFIADGLTHTGCLSIDNTKICIQGIE